MKNILAVLLALALAACLFACGGDKPQEPTSQPGPTSAPAQPADLTPAALQIELAEDNFTGDFHEYNAGGEGLTYIIRTDKAVTEFRYFTVGHTVEGDEILLFPEDVLLELDGLTPEKPFAVTLWMPETIPYNGISYVNADGSQKFFTLGESGMDGSPLLVAFEFEAMG